MLLMLLMFVVKRDIFIVNEPWLETSEVILLLVVVLAVDVVSAIVVVEYCFFRLSLIVILFCYQFSLIFQEINIPFSKFNLHLYEKYM